MKKSDKPKVQFSKVIVMIILIAGLLFVQESYILAFFGREAIAEDLSKYVITTLIGTILGYFLKSFSETRSARNADLEDKKIDIYTTLSSDEPSDDEPRPMFEFEDGIDDDDYPLMDEDE